MESTPSSPRQRWLPALLAASVLLLGTAAAAAYGWLLFYRPDVAEQAAAVASIVATFAVTVVSPLAGLLAWLALAPFAPFLPINIVMPVGIPDLGFTRLVAGFLVFYLLAQAARGRQRLRPANAIDLAIPIFVLALTIAALRAESGWLWGVQSVFDSYLVPLIGYFVARQIIRSDRELNVFVTVVVLVGVIIAALTIGEQLTGVGLVSTRGDTAYYAPGVYKVSSVLGNPAYIALALAVIAPLAIYGVLVASKSRQRLLFGAAFLVLEAGIFYTFNRAGWLGGLAALLVFVISQRRLARVALPVVAVLAFITHPLMEFHPGISDWPPPHLRKSHRLSSAGHPVRTGHPQSGAAAGGGMGELQSTGRGAGMESGLRPTHHPQHLPGHARLRRLFLARGYILLALAIVLALAQMSRRFRRRRLPVPLYLTAALASFLAYYLASVGFENHFAIYANMVFWAIIGATLGAAEGQESRG